MTAADAQSDAAVAPQVRPAHGGAVIGIPCPELRGRDRAFRAFGQRLSRRYDQLTLICIGPATLGAVGIGAGFASAHLPIALAFIAGAAELVCVSLWLPLLTVGRFDRHLDMVGSAAIRSSALSWAASLPGVPWPVTNADKIAWLANRVPPTIDPDVLAFEALFLGVLGRYDEARETITRMAPQTEMQFFQRAISLAHIEYENGGEGPLDEARRLSTDMAGADGRAARGELALEEAGRALIAGEPWGPVIEAAYSQIGPPPIGLVIRGGLEIRLPIVWKWLLVPLFLGAVAISVLYTFA